MPLNDLFMKFSTLGSYEHSAMFVIYTNVLRSIEKGDFSRVFYYLDALRLNAEFCTYVAEDADLGSIDGLERYARAREAGKNGDIAMALSFYKECTSFMDSFSRMMALQDGQLADMYQEALECYAQNTGESCQKARELLLELSAYGGYEDSEALQMMAGLLRATLEPTATPMRMPTPVSTWTPAPEPTMTPTSASSPAASAGASDIKPEYADCERILSAGRKRIDERKPA